MRKITLAEVARHAGVTHQTASRVLGGKAHLHAAETAQRVRAAAKALGYRPNAAAQALRSGSASTVALVAAFDGTDPLPAEALAAALADLDRRGWTLAMARTGLRPSDPNFMPRLLRQDLVTGVLAHGLGQRSLPLAQRLTAERIPAVWIGEDLPANALRFDEAGAMTGLGEALLEDGARRLLYCDGDLRSRPDPLGQERLAGFEACARASGQAWTTWLGRSDDGRDQRRDEVVAIVRDLQPDGLVCASPAEATFVLGEVLPVCGMTPGRECRLATIGTARDLRDLPILGMIRPWDDLIAQALDILGLLVDGADDQPSRSIPCRFRPAAP